MDEDDEGDKDDGQDADADDDNDVLWILIKFTERILGLVACT